MSMTKREQMDLRVALMRVQEADEKIKVLFGDKPTNTFASTNFVDRQPLVPNANIEFVLPGNGNVIQARIRDGWLEIMGNSSIEIVPQSSNVIQVRVKEK